MIDIEKARQLFKEAGIAFPKIPEELAEQLEEKHEWQFSTREIEMSPYNLDYYIHEIEQAWIEDYVIEDYTILSHSGHGVNSYALQYYIVYGRLEMFLHLGWGGAYMDAEKTATQARDCFSLADKLVPASQKSVKLQGEDYLRIVGSDFYGSYWEIPWKKDRMEFEGFRRPAEVLNDALNWLKKEST